MIDRIVCSWLCFAALHSRLSLPCDTAIQNHLERFDHSGQHIVVIFRISSYFHSLWLRHKTWNKNRKKYWTQQETFFLRKTRLYQHSCNIIYWLFRRTTLRCNFNCAFISIAYDTQYNLMDISCSIFITCSRRSLSFTGSMFLQYKAICQ